MRGNEKGFFHWKFFFNFFPHEKEWHHRNDERHQHERTRWIWKSSLIFFPLSQEGMNRIFLKIKFLEIFPPHGYFVTSFKAFFSILKISFSMHNLRPEFILHENKLRCCFNMETKVSFFSASITFSAVCLASVTTHHIVYLKKRQISGFSLLCKFHRVKIMLGEFLFCMNS